jgi:hypothetical protein
MCGVLKTVYNSTYVRVEVRVNVLLPVSSGESKTVEVLVAEAVILLDADSVFVVEDVGVLLGDTVRVLVCEGVTDFDGVTVDILLRVGDLETAPVGDSVLDPSGVPDTVLVPVRVIVSVAVPVRVSEGVSEVDGVLLDVGE